MVGGKICHLQCIARVPVGLVRGTRCLAGWIVGLMESVCCRNLFWLGWDDE